MRVGLAPLAGQPHALAPPVDAAGLDGDQPRGLRAAGLRNDHWWQRVLFVILDSVRIPYTSVGVQYDLNHKKWRGPGIGDPYEIAVLPTP